MDRFRLPTPPITILYVGSMDFGTDEQPGGVGHDMTFATPSLRVVSREFGEELGGRVVIEGSQAGAIVIGDEGVEIGIAFGMVDKAAMVGGTVLRHAVEVLGEAAVEALDHAVGLRPERPGEAVGDGMPGTGAVEGDAPPRACRGVCLSCRRR